MTAPVSHALSRRMLPSIAAVSSLIAILLFPCPSQAQPSLIPTAGALRRDFGEVARGRDLKHEFGLKNEGDEVAKITKIRKSCAACGPVRLGNDRIRPGKSTTVTLTFNAGKTRGKQVRRVFLHTNDPASSPTLEIVAEWTVRAFLETKPAEIRLAGKFHAATYERKIAVRVEGLKPPVEVTSVRCSSPHIKLGKPRKEARGKEIVIPLSILPTAPAGEFKEEVVIDTNYAKEPRIVVPITGKIQGPFRVKQTYVNFGAVPAGKRAARDVEISIVARGASKITGTECDEKLLECELSKPGPRRYILKTVLLPQTKAGALRTTITLRTTCPIQREIDLPVLAVIRKEGG